MAPVPADRNGYINDSGSDGGRKRLQRSEYLFHGFIDPWMLAPHLGGSVYRIGPQNSRQYHSGHRAQFGWILQIEDNYSTQGSGAAYHVSLEFFSGFFGITSGFLAWTLSLNIHSTSGSGATFHMECDFSQNRIFHMADSRTPRVLIEDFREKNSGMPGDYSRRPQNYS